MAAEPARTKLIRTLAMGFSNGEKIVQKTHLSSLRKEARLFLLCWAGDLRKCQQAWVKADWCRTTDLRDTY